MITKNLLIYLGIYISLLSCAQDKRQKLYVTLEFSPDTYQQSFVDIKDENGKITEVFRDIRIIKNTVQDTVRIGGTIPPNAMFDFIYPYYSDEKGNIGLLYTENIDPDTMSKIDKLLYVDNPKKTSGTIVLECYY